MNAPSIYRVNADNVGLLKKRSDSNTVYHTTTGNVYIEDVFKNFSIKILLKGAAHYQSNTDHYSLERENSVLIASKQPEGKVMLPGKTLTELICIDLKQQTIQEALSFCSNDLLGERDIRGISTAFLDGVYPLQSLNFNGKIERLKQCLVSGPSLECNPEWFLDLAQDVTCGQPSKQKLQCVRDSTKTELTRRLKMAKEYLDENFLLTPSVEQIATHCLLAEFHFFRSFKQLYGISPYQYQLKKRLIHAIKLLGTTDCEVQSIAQQTGFADLFTFSKAFKRKYKISPTDWKRLVKNHKYIAPSFVN
ncbi:MAG: helix-turn-helix transcriptional regulator [Chitinophagaceae bacterium]|nr:helix-turn-helix transcriptional regulator [Chitinophagaceae bacterium]